MLFLYLYVCVCVLGARIALSTHRESINASRQFVAKFCDNKAK